MEVDTINAAYQPGHLEIKRLTVRPKKSDIDVEPIAVVWVPWLVDSAELATEAS